MSAPNFYSTNPLGFYYVFREDVTAGEAMDALYSVASSLKPHPTGWDDSYIWEKDEPCGKGHYPAAEVAEVVWERIEENMAVEVHTRLLLRGGYYGGLNADWELHLIVYHDKVEWDESQIRDALEYAAQEEALAQEAVEPLLQEIMSAANTMADKVHAALKEREEIELLRLHGTMSNGEAVYVRAK